MRPLPVNARGDPALHQVSPSAQYALKHKKLGGTRTFESWRGLFAELAAFDTRVDLALTDSKNKAQYGCIGAFISIFVMTFGGTAIFAALDITDLRVVNAALVLGALVPIGLTFYAIYQHWFRTKIFNEINLFNEFRFLLVPVLRALRPDVAPGALASLEFYGSGPADTNRSDEYPVKSSRSNATERQARFVDRWCVFTVPLANKCRVRLTFTSTYLRNVREWTNVNGKSRKKTKWKKRQSVLIELRAPRRKLQFASVSPECEVVQKGDRSWARCRFKRRLAKVTGDDAPDKCVRTSDVMLHVMKLAKMLAPIPERTAR